MRHTDIQLSNQPSLVGKFSDSTPVCSHWSRPHDKYSLQYLCWNTLSTMKLFSKNRMHGVLELELEQTNNDCAMF